MLCFAAEGAESQYQIKECKSWFGNSEDVGIHHEYVPGCIKALIMCHCPNAIDDVEEQVYAVMETCEFQHKKSSLFTTQWESATMYLGQGGRNQRRVQQLELMKPSHFVGHCLMIAEDENFSISCGILVCGLMLTIKIDF